MPCSPFSAPAATTSARSVPAPVLATIAKRTPGSCHCPWTHGGEWPDRRLPVRSDQHVRTPRQLCFSAGPAMKRAACRGAMRPSGTGKCPPKGGSHIPQRRYTLREANNGLGRRTVFSPAACHSPASRGPLPLIHKPPHQRPMQPRCRHHHAPCLRMGRVEPQGRARPVRHHRPGPRRNQRDRRDVSFPRIVQCQHPVKPSLDHQVKPISQ